MVRVYLSGSNTRADFDDGRKLSFCPKQTRLSVDITGVFSLTDNILKVSERLGRYADVEGLNGQTFTDTESCLLYLESVVNPPKGVIYEDFNTSGFTAKIGYRHNVAILDQKDLNVNYPLGAVDGDRFFIVPLVNMELDSIIVGGEYIIESKNKEITTFTFNGANWIPIGGDVSAYQERVKIRMSGAGLMDFSVSGAAGVKWVMSTGEVYTQGSQVPSGDINRPKIVFSEAGWVKLYCDNFSTVTLRGNNNGILPYTSKLSDFNVSIFNLYLQNSPRITGDVSVLNILNNITLTGANISILYLDNAISANQMYLDSCNLSQLEIYNLIKYNYDLNNTNKTLNITNNSIPDAATIAMINEMTTNRGWTITHD